MSAVISDCGLYRYRLERHGLRGAGAVAWIMVNPSTADGEIDDPTIKKVRGFSERLDAGWLIVGNLCAYRATDVRDLKSIRDPIGPENNDHLGRIIDDAATVIVAWGPVKKLPGPMRSRWHTVVRLAKERDRTLMCYGTADDGHPLHPLMLGYDRPLVQWRPPV